MRYGRTGQPPLYPEILPALLNLGADEWAIKVACYRDLPVKLDAGDLEAAREFVRRFDRGEPLGAELRELFNRRIAERARWLVALAPAQSPPDLFKLIEWYDNNVRRIQEAAETAEKRLSRLEVLRADFGKRLVREVAMAAEARGGQDSAPAATGYAVSTGEARPATIRPEWLDGDLWMRLNEYLKNRDRCGALDECKRAECSRWFHVTPGNRPREFCSDACKAADYRDRHDREPSLDF